MGRKWKVDLKNYKYISGRSAYTTQTIVNLSTKEENEKLSTQFTHMLLILAFVSFRSINNSYEGSLYFIETFNITSVFTRQQLKQVSFARAFQTFCNKFL